MQVPGHAPRSILTENGMNPHPFIAAGIDGGGTSTRVVLVDARGDVLGFGEAGPANYHSVGLETVQRNLRAAYEAAWKQAGEQAGQNGVENDGPRFCDQAFLGLAGVATEDDRTRLIQIALEIGIAPEDRITIDHDMRIALAGAMPDRLATTGGIVLIAGTGSVAFGQVPSDSLESSDPGAPPRTARAGGMGSVFDDAGSGYYIGRRAVSAAIRAADGRGQATVLSDIVQQAFGADLRQIVTGLSPTPTKRDNIARLAPHVIDAANQHDAVADRILRTAANELALCAAAVARQLDFDINMPIPIAITGGLANAGTDGSSFLPYIHRAAAPMLPNVEWIEPAMSPVMGAAWLALRNADPVNEVALEAIEQTLRAQS